MGRWINRDPLGDYSFFSSITSNKTWSEREKIRLSSLDPLYLFNDNDPVDYVDPKGLVEYNCALFATTYMVIARIVGNCTSQCDEYNKKSYSFDIDVVLYGVTIGIPLSFTGFNVLLYTDNLKSNPQDLVGWSKFISTGVALIGGYSISSIKIGQAHTKCSPTDAHCLNDGTEGEQVGIDGSLDIFYGTSKIKANEDGKNIEEECCPEL